MTTIKSKKVLSIDPDKSGGACLFQDGELFEVGYFNRTKDDRFEQVRRFVSWWMPDIILVEFCFRPRSIVIAEGVILGMCMGITNGKAGVYEINPRTWQKLYKIEGTDGLAKKDRSIAIFERYNKDIDLRFGNRAKKHGVADAYCMGRYVINHGGDINDYKRFGYT